MSTTTGSMRTSMSESDARAVLGIDAEADLRAARAAYRNQARLFHPDVVGALPEEARRAAHDNMVRLNEAWQTIQDRERAGVLGRTDSPGSDDLGATEFRLRPRGTGPHECRICGSVPAEPVTFRQVTTILFWASTGTASGPFCRGCGLAVYADAQHVTLTRGWWGIGAFWAPFLLLANLVTARGLRRARAAAFRDPAVVTMAHGPLPPTRSLLAMPTNWIGPILFAATAAILVVGSASTPTTSRTPAPLPSSSSAPGTKQAAADRYVNTCWTAPAAGASSGTVSKVPCDSPAAAYVVTSIGTTCEGIEVEGGWTACVTPR